MRMTGHVARIFRLRGAAELPAFEEAGYNKRGAASCCFFLRSSIQWRVWDNESQITNHESNHDRRRHRQFSTHAGGESI
jgi:hypothetical protein